MKFILFAIVSLFVLQASSDSKFFFGNLTSDGQTYQNILTNDFPNAPGLVQLSLYTSYPTEVCIQESIPNNGPLSDCTFYQFFNVTPENATTNVADFNFESKLLFKDFDELNQAYFTSYYDLVSTHFDAETSLVPGKAYYLSVRLNQTIDVNNTASFNLTVSWSDQVCGGDSIASPDGNCASPIKSTVSAGSNTSVTTSPLAQNASALYDTSIPSASNGQFIDSWFITAKYASSSVALDSDSDSSAPTLYVREGAAPSAEYYDSMGQGSVNFTNPSPNAAYYWSVKNNQATSASIIVTSSITVCNSTTGAHCVVLEADLTGITYAMHKEGSGAFQYYMVNTTNNTDLKIGAGTADLDVVGPVVLVSLDTYPTNSSYLLRAEGNEVNFIWASPQKTNTTWFVGIWFEEEEDYIVWANGNCPNNCGGISDDDDGDDDADYETEVHGTCITTAGICNCDDDYEGIACNSSGLSTLWIVLIVIFSIVIVAIIVGVAVALYMKKKKRSHYESV